MNFTPKEILLSRKPTVIITLRPKFLKKRPGNTTDVILPKESFSKTKTVLWLDLIGKEKSSAINSWLPPVNSDPT